MPQSHAEILLHLVYSTKNRVPFLADIEVRNAMHQYLGATSANLDCPTLIVGGPADHVHLLLRLGRSIMVETLVKELKVESSKWIKNQGHQFVTFHWQSGYSIFSVSPSHSRRLIPYITSQERHHKKESFQDEARRLFEKYEVEYDERYVWD